MLLKYFGMKIGIKILIFKKLFVLLVYGISDRSLMILEKI